MFCRQSRLLVSFFIFLFIPGANYIDAFFLGIYVA